MKFLQPLKNLKIHQATVPHDRVYLKNSGNEPMAVTSLYGNQRTLQTPHGECLGATFQWPTGQYCAIHTDRGMIGCGIYDVKVAGEFGIVIAIAKGTPAQPLREPEDLYEARIVEASEPAQQLGILPGMTGMEALAKLLV